MKQLDFYGNEGLPQNEPVSATGIIIRDEVIHCDFSDIHKFNNIWWEQIEKYSHRDQISLPYARWKMNWKAGVDYHETEYRKREPWWFDILGHRLRKK